MATQQQNRYYSKKQLKSFTNYKNTLECVNMYSLEYLTIKESNEMQITLPFITVAMVTTPE